MASTVCSILLVDRGLCELEYVSYSHSADTQFHICIALVFWASRREHVLGTPFFPCPR